MADAPAMRTPELLERLRRHYIKPGAPLPGGVFLPEVTYAGAGGSRCDALHIGFTSTSGRILTGHELKVSRADWQHELDRNGKADTWADQCHAWYVVAPSTDVVPVETLPAGWGLMVPSARTRTRLQVVRAARLWPERTPSWDAMRSVVSRMDTLRANHDLDVRHEAREAANAEAERRITETVERRVRQAGTPNAHDLADRLARIERALGGRITDGDDAPYLDVHWRDQTIGTVPLEQVGALLRAHRTVRQAARQLSERFELRTVQRRLAELETGLSDLALLADPPQPDPTDPTDAPQLPDTTPHATT